VITTPITAELIRGALELVPTERGLLPHRLPARVGTRGADATVLQAARQPSGVRVALRTAATVIELETLPTKPVYPGAPPRPDGVYELLVDRHPVDRRTAPGGNSMIIDLATGASRVEPGPTQTIRFDGLPAGDKDVEIWLPYNEITELIMLRSDAPVAPLPERGRPVWLHHGSSISHGSNADSATATWPAVAAALGGMELINVGLSGNALLDPFVARALRDTPADLISIKIGINVVNADLMRLRAFGPAVHGFLDTIRDGHPDTPLLVVSPIHCAIHETTPGPTAMDPSGFAEGRLSFYAAGDAAEATELATGKLTLSRIRETLAGIVEQRSADDPNLRYLDGLRLYGPDDEAELPLPDRLHPGPEAHRRIGERFAALALAPS